MKKPQETCTCAAYKFPHRKGGGDCADEQDRLLREREANEQYYQSRGLITSYSRAMHDSGHEERDFL